MHPKLSSILLSIFLLPPAVAYAQVPPVEATMESAESVAFGECWWLGENATTPVSNRTEFERECRASLIPKITEQRQSLTEVEQQMAIEYRQLLAMLQQQGRIRTNSLVLSQRTWAKFRESHCTLEVERVMGNYRSPHRLAACLEAEARKRSEYLKGFTK
ncbi:lysozyme inhibitor LprI family protein [Polaromonas sp. JS666]|uniref:lysozyme inhibitor LprI family protein n=1 Tax=Polaromonas sp. (strain JS666 / ATCC BAA-500) TaxID=296591 RepID=UPI0009D7659E|nr:lysozyme inhibitor LprI family protein [Polaromonas sp. JS666]